MVGEGAPRGNGEFGQEVDRFHTQQEMGQEALKNSGEGDENVERQKLEEQLKKVPKTKAGYELVLNLARDQETGGALEDEFKQWLLNNYAEGQEIALPTVEDRARFEMAMGVGETEAQEGMPGAASGEFDDNKFEAKDSVLMAEAFDPDGWNKFLVDRAELVEWTKKQLREAANEGQAEVEQVKRSFVYAVMDLADDWNEKHTAIAQISAEKLGEEAQVEAEEIANLVLGEMMQEQMKEQERQEKERLKKNKRFKKFALGVAAVAGAGLLVAIGWVTSRRGRGTIVVPQTGIETEGAMESSGEDMIEEETLAERGNMLDNPELLKGDVDLQRWNLQKLGDELYEGFEDMEGVEVARNGMMANPAEYNSEGKSAADSFGLSKEGILDEEDWQEKLADSALDMYKNQPQTLASFIAATPGIERGLVSKGVLDKSILDIVDPGVKAQRIYATMLNAENGGDLQKQMYAAAYLGMKNENTEFAIDENWNGGQVVTFVMPMVASTGGFMDSVGIGARQVNQSGKIVRRTIKFADGTKSEGDMHLGCGIQDNPTAVQEDVIEVETSEEPEVTTFVYNEETQKVVPVEQETTRAQETTTAQETTKAAETTPQETETTPQETQPTQPEIKPTEPQTPEEAEPETPEEIKKKNPENLQNGVNEGLKDQGINNPVTQTPVINPNQPGTVPDNTTGNQTPPGAVTERPSFPAPADSVPVQEATGANQSGGNEGGTSAAPEGTTAAPQESSGGGQESSGAPQESSGGNQESSGGGQESSGATQGETQGNITYSDQDYEDAL